MADEWSSADIHRLDQDSAGAMADWRAEVAAAVELVRRRQAAHPGEVPGLMFAVLVAELQDRHADRTAADQLAGARFLAATALLMLAEV